jgi:hypothetical protein
MQRRWSFLVFTTFVLVSIFPVRGGEPGSARGEASPPNLVLDISAALVNKAVQRSVDRSEPVEDVILERLVRGCGRTQGTVHAELIPDPCRAVVDIVLDGTVTSKEVAYTPLLHLHSSTTTPLVARHRVTLDGHGIRSYVGPVHAHAVTALRCVTDREGDPYAPGSQLAAYGFWMNKEEAEAEASAHTADRLAHRMAEDLAPELARGGQAIAKGLALYRAVGLDLRCLSFNTAPDRVQVQMRFATPGQPRPGLPPAVCDADLVGRVHQSVINEMARVALGGKTFSPAELVKRAEEAFGSLILDGGAKGKPQETGLLLEKLLAGLGKQAVVITAATNDPVTVSFADKGITLQVHIAELRLSGVALPGVKVSATYRSEYSAGKVRAVRQGPITFRPDAGKSGTDKKLSGPAALLAPLVEALFAHIFKEQLVLADLSLPEPVSGLGQLAGVRAEARDGWLVVAWKQPGLTPCPGGALLVGPEVP